MPRNHFFTTNIIPELKFIKEEFDLISRLTRYEKSALIFTANEIEYKHKPTTYHNAKKISSSLERFYKPVSILFRHSVHPTVEH